MIDEQQPRVIGIGGGLAISPILKSSIPIIVATGMLDKVFHSRGALWAVCCGLSGRSFGGLAGPGKLLGDVCNINVIFRFYAAD